MKQKLNHNRQLDYYRRVGERAVETAQATPTHKQVKFVRKLFAMCRENGVDTATGERMKTRVEYAMMIDTLLARLQAAGVDVWGNGKEAVYVVSIGEDGCGGYKHTARIVVADAPKSALVRKLEGLMEGYRARANEAD